MVEKVQELTGLLGSKNVISSAEVIEEYSKDLSFVPRIKPRFIVKPRTADEIQALVKWANSTLTPLVPVSSGPPHFRGDTVPSTGGEVIVDLRGMNKILRIDSRNRVAMIEPGVTFSELIPQLEQKGLRLNMPLAPRSTKSVIGSLLEREPVTMPLYQWDAVDPLSCIEVVFGTGDTFRTGAASGPGTLEQQWNAKQAQVCPMGPGHTDFARVVQGAQGTLGIVTWATVKCEELPKLKKPFLASSEKLEKLSDFIYRMIWLRAMDECLVLNNNTLAALMSKNSEEYNSLKAALPRWVFFFCLAGYEYFPEERIEFQEESMLEAAQQFAFEPKRTVSGVAANELLRTMNSPSEEPYWKLRAKGACHDILFTTTLDRVPEFVEVMDEAAGRAGYPSTEIGMYIQPMVMGSSCHCEFNLFYDPTNAAEVSRIRQLYVQAGEALMNAGAFFSRPYEGLAELAFRRDGQSLAALKKAKQIFDPNAILNPGKLCF
jgi:FAD/FMN-containing dehydrogenase